ncbi:uncharacterized protein [Littorina saxatilis]|uniref:Uncharacterized protein n=1 Tax=Littorina saxatilis TaxID=31220 RepID=A0AAN9BBV5_9CAEN
MDRSPDRDSLFSLREMVDQQAKEQAIFAARLADFPHSFQLRSPDSLTSTRLKKLTKGLESALSVGYKTGLETARARNLLAYFLHCMDRTDDALNELNKVLAMEDQHDNLVTLANKANILRKQYRLSEADEHVERLQQIQEKSPDFKYLVTKAKAELAFTYSRHEPSFFPDAERIFLEVIPDAREPELWLWKFGLALTRRREIRVKPHEMVPTPTADVMKELRDLLDLFLKIAKKCSSENLRAKVYAEIAIVLNHVRKTTHQKTFYKKAGMNVHEACERALDLDGDDNSVLCKCGKMFRYVARNEESRELLEKAVSIRPSSTGFHHLGLTLQRLAQPQLPGYHHYHRPQHSRGSGTSRYQNMVQQFGSMSVGRSAQSEGYEPHRLFGEQMPPNSGNRGNNRRGNRGRYNRGNPENHRQAPGVPGRYTNQHNNPQHHPGTRFPRGNSVQHYNGNRTPTGRNNAGDAQGMTFTRGGYAANSRDQHHDASGMSAASRGTKLSVSLPESKEAKIMQELMKSPTKEMTDLSWDNMLVREAERNFELAVEFSEGENTRALFDLALVRTKIGLKEKALADLKKILQIEKNICVFEHIRVYEQMGSIIKEMAESEANGEKRKQLLNDSKSMLYHSLTIASRFFSRSQGEKEYIREVLVSFSALLKDVEDSDCSAHQKLKEKAKLYQLIRDHGQSLDLLKEIEKMDPEKTEDPEYLKLCITQYMALEKFDEALAFKSLLECTSQGMQTMQLFGDPSFEAKLYIQAARHALLHDKPSAKAHFQTLFHDTVLLNVDHESVTSEDTDASGDPRTEAGTWDIMIVHEDRTEEKAATLTHILQDTCGLSVATVNKVVPPNKLELEGGLRIMRRSTMVLVLAGTKPVSKEMRFLMDRAVKRQTTVTLLVDGERVPEMLHTHRSMVCPGHLFTEPAGAEAAEIERERRTLQVNAICNVIRFIVNLDMNADWV